jgi:hypothetical protein
MLQRDPGRCSEVANLEMAAPVKGVTPVEEVKRTKPWKYVSRAGFGYLQCQFESPVLQVCCSFWWC